MMIASRQTVTTSTEVFCVPISLGNRCLNVRAESPAVVALYSPHGISSNGRRAISFDIEAINGEDEEVELENSLNTMTSQKERETYISDVIRAKKAKWSSKSFLRSEKHVSVSGMEISNDGTALLASIKVTKCTPSLCSEVRRCKSSRRGNSMTWSRPLISVQSKYLGAY